MLASGLIPFSNHREKLWFLFCPLREGLTRIWSCKFYLSLDSLLLVKNREITWIPMSWQSFEVNETNLNELTWLIKSSSFWMFHFDGQERKHTKLCERRNVSTLLSWQEALHHQTFDNHAQDVTLCVPVCGVSSPSQIQCHVIEIKHFPKSCHQLIFQGSTF